DRYNIDDQQTTDVVNAWAEVLHLLEHDPAQLADRLDWIAKYQLLNGMRKRHGLGWDDAKLAMLDMQWPAYARIKAGTTPWDHAARFAPSSAKPKFKTQCTCHRRQHAHGLGDDSLSGLAPIWPAYPGKQFWSDRAEPDRSSAFTCWNHWPAPNKTPTNYWLPENHNSLRTTLPPTVLK